MNPGLLALNPLLLRSRPVLPMAEGAGADNRHTDNIHILGS